MLSGFVWIFFSFHLTPVVEYESIKKYIGSQSKTWDIAKEALEAIIVDSGELVSNSTFRAVLLT